MASNTIYLTADVESRLLSSSKGSIIVEGTEQTYKVKQKDIINTIGSDDGEKSFSVNLSGSGPYCLDFSRNGSRLAIGGEKGHFVEIQRQTMRINCEVQVKEIIHDIKYLNAFQNVAIAQKHYVYLYDSQGIEVHCLKEHAGARKLEFLPQHMLLASVGKGGLLCYQDMTTGIVVSRNKTHDKFCDVMRQNPWNAVLGLGHTNGTVSMWTPNVSTPVIKMLCHRGPIQTMANDPTGNILVTSGIDCQIKVWDIRNLKIIHQYFSKNIVTSSEISQNGLLALASGNGIQIWKESFTTKQHSPYMYYKLARGSIRGMAFCPYEDLLAFGHSDGIATIIIPGSGEPNFDSYAANPYRSTKSSKKIELRNLIEKLKPETIVFNPESIGGMQTEIKTINKINTFPNTDVKRRRSNNSHKKTICNTFAKIDKTQIKRLNKS